MSLSAPLLFPPLVHIVTAMTHALPPCPFLSSHAGNGAIFFYAGDRVTLTPAGHEVVGSTVSYSNRYLYCYVPMVRRVGVSYSNRYLYCYVTMVRRR